MPDLSNRSRARAAIFVIALSSVVLSVPRTAAARPQQTDAPPLKTTAPAVAANKTPAPDGADESTNEGLQPPESIFPHVSSSRYWLSGQANFIFQTHPDFPAAYSGTHSLSDRY